LVSGDAVQEKAADYLRHESLGYPAFDARQKSLVVTLGSAVKS